MKIRISRPDDAELAELYDKARREILERVRQQQPDSDCCVGDRSQCRCAPERGGWSDEDVEREKWIAVWSDSDA